MSCCPPIVWCTPTGPVEVTPDGDGVYTRPAGATGHPFRSQAEAAAECPFRCEGDCSLTFSPVTISLEAATGELFNATGVLNLGIANQDLCVVGGWVDIPVATSRCTPYSQTFIRFEYMAAPSLYEILQVFNARDCGGSLRVIWLSVESGYTLASIPSGPLMPHRMTKNTPTPCGSSLPGARRKLGRIALQNGSGSTTYGEADVYMQ